MPEWDTQPANHYLPRQITDSVIDTVALAAKDG